MRLLLTCLVLVGLASPAVACINDIELPSHEREFRSQYRQYTTPGSPSTEPGKSPNYNLVLGAGVVLLTGAIALTITNPQPKK